MNQENQLGKFEEIVLTAVMSLGGESYGVPIYDEVHKLNDKRPNHGALYTTLDRLEQKGLLESRLSDPKKELRGKSKRFYRLTPEGLKALQDSIEDAKRVAEMFDKKIGGIRQWLKKRSHKLVPAKLLAKE